MARGLDFDIVAQGKDLRELESELSYVVEAEIALAEKSGTEPLANLRRKPTSEEQKLWSEARPLREPLIFHRHWKIRRHSRTGHPERAQLSLV